MGTHAKSFYAVTIALVLSNVARAGVTSHPGQLFMVNTDGLDFVNVESSRTLNQQHINIGVAVDHARNTLPSIQSKGQTRPGSEMKSAVMGVAIGLTDSLEWNAQTSLILAQDMSQSLSTVGYAKQGLTIVRSGLKYSLLQRSPIGFAVFGEIESDRVADDPFNGSRGTLAGNFGFAVDTSLAETLIALNLGRIARPMLNAPQWSQVEPLASQTTFSLALSRSVFRRDLAAVVEVYGATTGISGPTSSTAEAMLSARFDYNREWTVLGGVGRDIAGGLFAADQRFFAGLIYHFTSPEPEKPQPLPAPAPPEPKRPPEVLRLDALHFASNDAQISEQDYASLARVASQLVNLRTRRKIQIQGHADARGNHTANRVLSEKRAQAVANFLCQKQAALCGRFEVIGFGDSHPSAPNADAEGRRQNRRVDLFLPAEDWL